MRHILQLLTVILSAAVIFLLLTMISAFDRAREAANSLKERLAAATTANLLSPEEKDGSFANQQYFSRDAAVGGKLALAISAAPPGLNPLLANEAAAQSIFSLCSMTLAERNWQHPEKFQMLLAESVTASDDHLTYHIKLRDGVFWQPFTDPETGKTHPGKKVTAHDIKFTVDVIKNPAVNCAPLRSYYQDISEVTILNDLELTITWKRKYYGSLASTLGLFPLPRHLYCGNDGVFDPAKFNDSHRRNRMIVSCGPYIFKEWSGNSRTIKLERNPAYIGRAYRAAPAIVHRDFEIIQLPNTQFQSLLAGKIGMLSLTPEQWHTRTGGKEFTSGKFKKLRYPGMSYSYIGYNQQLACFKDAETRRALTMLIDRQAILEKLMYGCGQLAKGPFAPGSVYSDPELSPLPYDPEKAKQLLRQAGWRDTDGDGILERDGKKFTFTMLQISGSSMQLRMLPMIKNYFAAAGIDMKLQTVEWSVLIERLKKREFEACNLGWTGSVDPDPYQIFHSSQASDNGDNFVSFKNSRADFLIESLRQEFDLEKRIKISREIESILQQEQPYTFMFYPDSLLAVSSKYENIRLFPLGVEPISFYLKKEFLP
ncbi:MAG: hypothetical protein E7043_09615 [Lentisphaerae bacterium]|nr:hypothetical protein [Lentisphaerota bacterium]